MHQLDWAVVAAYTVGAVVFSIWLARRHEGAKSGEDYIVADRRLPWWLIGIADVATYGGADAYWVFVFFAAGFMGYHRFFWISLAVAMPLEVLWARYWRRLSLSSPGQLYEVRYSGEAAARFRAFSAVYGVLFSISLVLGYVLMGLAQSIVPFFSWTQDQVLLFFCGSTLLYTVLSGLLGVAYSDIGQFLFMMLGRLLLCVLLLASLGGLSTVLDKVVAVRGAAFLQPYPPSPASSSALFGEFAIDPLSLLSLVLLGVFSVAHTDKPVIQKSLAAKNEFHAAAGQVFNGVLSLLLRVLPVALIGLCAVALLAPSRTDTNMWADLVRGYASKYPGLTGMLLIGIVAGYVSCIDGLVNFGAANLLNDVYRRYLNPNASAKEQVRFGRLATVAVMAMGYLWARVLIVKVDGAWLNFINSVIGLFMLPLGLLRWCWWRLNIWGEIVGFVVSAPLSYAVWFGLPGVFPAFKDRPYYQSFALLFGLGWGVILLTTYLTKPESPEVLRRFYERARPPGFWGPIRRLLVEDLDQVQGENRTLERRYDLGTVLAGWCFTFGGVFALAGALSRHYLLACGSAVLMAAGICGFIFCTVRAERLRRVGLPPQT